MNSYFASNSLSVLLNLETDGTKRELISNCIEKLWYLCLKTIENKNIVRIEAIDNF